MLSTNQFEFLKLVQRFKRHARFCVLKLGLKLEKCLTETKKEMWQIRWHCKDTKNGGFFCSGKIDSPQNHNDSVVISCSFHVLSYLWIVTCHKMVMQDCPILQSN